MTRIELKNAAKEQIQGKIGLLFVMFLIAIYSPPKDVTKIRLPL